MKTGPVFLKYLPQIFLLVMALCLIAPFLLHAQVDLRKPAADFPSHYIFLIDQSGSMTRKSHRATDVADIQSLVSERVPELITRPEEHGISLPPYRLGKDYLSVIFFGIPKAGRDFGNLLHPAVIFWSGTDQFQILKKRINADLFNAYYSAISVATPLSLALIRESLSQPKVLDDPKLAEADLRFSRTFGIILTDAKENLEGSSLNVLEYLARAGRVQGSEEARTRIQQVRRYYDYESNVRTFPDEGQTGRFLIGIREFVPKEVALPNLVANIADVELERFAPTPSEIFYKGQIELNFLSPDQLPYQYYFYSPRELRWKRETEAEYDRIALDRSELRAEPLTLPVEFEKPTASTPDRDTHKHFLVELNFTYDFRDPVYGFNVQTFEDKVALFPAPLDCVLLPLAGEVCISEEMLQFFSPRTPEEIQSLLLGTFWILSSLLIAGFVFYGAWPPLKADIQEGDTDQEPIVIDFNSRSGEHIVPIKNFTAINIAKKRFFFLPPLWSRLFSLHLDVSGDLNNAVILAANTPLLGMREQGQQLHPRASLPRVTAGQELSIYCQPQAIADFRGNGQEIELTYTVRAFQRKRFRIVSQNRSKTDASAWEIIVRLVKQTIEFFRLQEIPTPTVLRGTVKFRFLPEKTQPVPQLLIQPDFQSEGIEHRKGELLPLGQLVVQSSAQHYCSEPAACTYVVMGGKGEERTEEEKGYVLIGDIEGPARAEANGSGVKTRIEIPKLGYREEIKAYLLADFDRIGNPEIDAERYEIEVAELQIV